MEKISTPRSTLNRSEIDVRGAIEANLRAFHVSMGQWPEIEVHFERDRLWTASGRPWSLFNVVLEARFSARDVDRRIACSLERFEGRPVNVMWKCGPSTTPPRLVRRLGRYGFHPVQPLHGMALDLRTWRGAAPMSPGLSVAAVSDAGTLREWREVLRRGFAWPDYGIDGIADNLAFFGYGDDRDFVVLLARDEGRPVGTSLVFFGGDAAGLYYVSTVPEVRRRGIGTAVTVAALAHARARGRRLAVLHATDMGRPIYHRLGFRERCRIRCALRMGSA
jgi:ribosomal protein S18 acetylase RimI-like enzyme